MQTPFFVLYNKQYSYLHCIKIVFTIVSYLETTEYKGPDADCIMTSTPLWTRDQVALGFGELCENLSACPIDIGMAVGPNTDES